MKSNQKKIRDLQRILKKLQQSSNGSSNANEGDVSVKISEIEAKIRELESMKENNIQKEIKRKHESKYHMVKFFERKKITRKIHKIINRLRKCEEESNETSKEQLLRQQSQLEDDLTYIMYYPPQMKYVALFASSERQVLRESGEGGDANLDESDEETLTHGQLSKSQKLMEKARDLARKARSDDIARNNKDRVQHAIEVELEEKKSAKEVDKDKDTGKRNMNSSVLSVPKNELKEDSEELQTAGKKRGREKQEKNEINDIVKKPKSEKNSSNIPSATDSFEPESTSDFKDEFFLDENDDAPEISTIPRQSVPIDYQQLKQVVNKKKHQHHKRFSSKKSNLSKF